MFWAAFLKVAIDFWDPGSYFMKYEAVYSPPDECLKSPLSFENLAYSPFACVWERDDATDKDK